MTAETERLLVSPCDGKELETLASLYRESSGLYMEAAEMSRNRPQWELFTFWKAVLKGSGELVADVRLKGLHPHGEVEIGYRTLEGYRGRGFASEAVAAVCSYLGGVHEVKFVSALTQEGNAASHRVLEKNGFRRDGEKFGYMYWKKVI